MSDKGVIVLHQYTNIYHICIEYYYLLHNLFSFYRFIPDIPQM